MNQTRNLDRELYILAGIVSLTIAIGFSFGLGAGFAFLGLSSFVAAANAKG